jgi:glycosyltransferase involved in cell wall biosynthesis
VSHTPGREPSRILYLTWRDLDHPEAGGAEVFAERTASELSALGREVVMFSSAWEGAAPAAQRDGFTIVRRGRRYTVYLCALLHLLLHGRRYDAVIDVQNGVPFWAPLVFRGPVINLTHHVHREQWSAFFAEPIARFGWFLESRIAPLVYRRSRYVTVSESSRADLVSVGVDAERISLVYSGIDLPEDYASYDAVPKSANPTIITVCRLVPHKQIELAIDAVADLRRRIPDLQLHVVGDGFWLDKLREHSRRLGVDDQVVFHGFVDPEVKHDLLARSWVMAMPSLKEGWGLTIIEAGLHSTPSIAFRQAGGTQESIQDHETGLLVDDSEEMIEGLQRLLTDVDYREKLGSNARDFARSFSWQASGRDLDAIITDELTWP